MTRTIRAVDLFCGAGGSSTGLAQAVQELGADLELLAVNHWPRAVETHSANHPRARHICATLDGVDPKKFAPSGPLDLLIASPECTHHSSARGGKPCSDQSRASAWHVVHWAEILKPAAILVENVPEFRTWGPLNANDRPDKARAGQTFDAWIQAFRSLGYSVDFRILNAADYGDATTRRRLFVMARRGNALLPWPSASHSRDGASNRRWRPARDVIDWSLQGASIFDRARPLAPSTMRRIEEGLRRFGGPAAEPFLVVLRNHMGGRSIDLPVPAIAAAGGHMGLAEPLILGQQSGGLARPVSAPSPTIAGKGALSLVEPFVTHLTHGGRVHDTREPLPTVTGANRGELGAVQPVVVPYYGTGRAAPVSEPLRTITTKDRFALAQCGPRYDIRFRMLQPHELAAAMSFPSDYRFTGNKGDVVRQIGNAVPIRKARALCRALLAATA